MINLNYNTYLPSSTYSYLPIYFSIKLQRNSPVMKWILYIYCIGWYVYLQPKTPYENPRSKSGTAILV